MLQRGCLSPSFPYRLHACSDLAARNVLVAHDFTCRVSDFGLSKEIDGECRCWETTALSLLSSSLLTVMGYRLLSQSRQGADPLDSIGSSVCWVRVYLQDNTMVKLISCVLANTPRRRTFGLLALPWLVASKRCFANLSDLSATSGRSSPKGSDHTAICQTEMLPSTFSKATGWIRRLLVRSRYTIELAFDHPA
jgi:hypothetical protein